MTTEAIGSLQSCVQVEPPRSCLFKNWRIVVVGSAAMAAVVSGIIFRKIHYIFFGLLAVPALYEAYIDNIRAKDHAAASLANKQMYAKFSASLDTLSFELAKDCDPLKKAEKITELYDAMTACGDLPPKLSNTFNPRSALFSSLLSDLESLKNKTEHLDQLFARLEGSLAIAKRICVT